MKHQAKRKNIKKTDSAFAIFYLYLFNKKINPVKNSTIKNHTANSGYPQQMIGNHPYHLGRRC